MINTHTQAPAAPPKLSEAASLALFNDKKLAAGCDGVAKSVHKAYQDYQSPKVLGVVCCVFV